jgi:phage terminase large subunit
MRPAAAKLKRWRENPAAFVHEELKATPDAWQLEALQVFPSLDRDKLRIALQACVGPGKTTCESWLAWNFLACYGDIGEHPRGAAVSVSWDNLKANLWPEIAKWQARSEFLKETFTWTAERIYANDFPETWFLQARSWSKSADPEQLGKTLSGLHAKYVLVLIDESGTIPIEILKSADQVLSNCSFGKIVQAGNPSSLEGMLYIAATAQRHLWYVIRITGDPEDPKRSPRIDKAWAEEQIKLYGRTDPWVMYSILGQFPPSSINQLLSVTEVESAMGRDLKKHQFDWAQKRLGIDAAWRGDDKWVIFPRQGLAAFKPVAMRNPKTEEVGSRIIQAKLNFGSEREYFDDTGGFAAGASDFFAAAGYTPIRIDFSGKPQDPRFYNIRAEMYWRAAQAIKQGAALPLVREIVAEASTPTYTYKDGKFLVESKDQIKARLKRSPDYWDAYVLTYAEPEMPRTIANQLKQSPHAQANWDPYRDEDKETRAKTDFDPYRDGV